MNTESHKPIEPPKITVGGIVERNPAHLIPFKTNARKHPKRQMTALRASIQEFTFAVPVLVNPESMILSGHARRDVAVQLGLTSIPTRVIYGMTPAQERAFVLADNKIAQLSEWDDDLLKGELKFLLEEDFQVEITGFSTAEIDLRLEEPMGAKADAADLRPEDIRVSLVSRLGDLWILRNHRLLCGDALQPDAYTRLLNGLMARMVITDPPYNVHVPGHVSGNGKVQHKDFIMASGEMTPQQFTDFLRGALTLVYPACAENTVIYIFMDWRHMRELQDAAEALFGPQSQLCIWCKDNGGMGSFYRSAHELVFIYRKGPGPFINNFELGQHGRYRTNVWNYPGVNAFTVNGASLLAMHPTVKPVSMIADAIRDCSRRNDIILDPFAGSGTILVAAERTGRHARAMELDPKYVDVAVARWQRVTGKQAILESTGQTWDEVCAERMASVPQGGEHGCV